ncbi:Fe-S oxidoreductase [Halobacteroides halobius DSM 5150]|uniref:Fe-S oxidoreductase n=1 Tax=Halobacteroides halobius (strain ATCC 35273 / DSM 5150 / MD-1) TaxID=748449 RepID=L0K935_HALHC|nr:DUF512 domain-containing protein [Halobacteroides halobius]AGB41531.1 Fe-S oxidoreductase [Halobacteroides halobius DSM 5150]
MKQEQNKQMEIESYVEIEKVAKDSIADELGLNPGDRIIKINGQTIKDFIEYKFLITDTYLELEVITLEGEYWVLEIEKGYDETLGIDFSDIIFDELKTCHNNCVFCFVDQAPSNSRDTLNKKDDDYRFSFLSGSYITLTNLSKEEFNRIKRLRLSPLNISVHSTNPRVRKKMLGNKQAGKILEQIKELIAAGIKLNTQIVLCPEINDGQYLEETIKKLGEFVPQINSLAIVPVGLTKFRDDLYNLRSFTTEEAQRVIKTVEDWQAKFKEKHGFNFVYLADEFYFLANKPIPSAKNYDQFPQLENGIGMVRILWDQFTELKNQIPVSLEQTRKVTVVTGVLGAKALAPLVESLNNIDNLEVDLLEVENDYFGSEVTVTGLLTGRDILSTLAKSKLGEVVLIPEVLLNDDQLFLDDLAWSEFKKEISSQLLRVDNKALDLVEKVLGIELGGEGDE